MLIGDDADDVDDNGDDEIVHLKTGNHNQASGLPVVTDGNALYFY